MAFIHILNVKWYNLLTMTIDEVREKIVPVLRRSGVEYAGVFGSVARGEAGPESDLDILVRYKETPGLFAHIGLAQSLEDILHTKVDLVTERSLKKNLAIHVKKDLKNIYGNTQRQDL